MCGSDSRHSGTKPNVRRKAMTAERAPFPNAVRAAEAKMFVPAKR